MKRTKWNPRKVLVASAGVASVNYALVAGCSDDERTHVSVANLMPCPPSQCPDNGIGGALVANLVAMPPGGNFGGGNGGNGGFAGASVANLVAPPPGGASGTPELPDASPPEPGDAGSQDAAADGAG